MSVLTYLIIALGKRYSRVANLRNLPTLKSQLKGLYPPDSTKKYITQYSSILKPSMILDQFTLVRYQPAQSRFQAIRASVSTMFHNPPICRYF